MQTFETRNLPILGAFWKYGSWLRGLVFVTFGAGLGLFPSYLAVVVFARAVYTILLHFQTAAQVVKY